MNSVYFRRNIILSLRIKLQTTRPASNDRSTKNPPACQINNPGAHTYENTRQLRSNPPTEAHQNDDHKTHIQMDITNCQMAAAGNSTLARPGSNTFSNGVEDYRESVWAESEPDAISNQWTSPVFPEAIGVSGVGGLYNK